MYIKNYELGYTANISQNLSINVRFCCDVFVHIGYTKEGEPVFQKEDYSPCFTIEEAHPYITGIVNINGGEATSEWEMEVSFSGSTEAAKLGLILQDCIEEVRKISESENG